MRIGNSCAAVTGYDFPMPICQNRSVGRGGEGGKKVCGFEKKIEPAESQKSEHFHRSLSFVPACAGPRKNFFAKKKNEGSGRARLALRFVLSKPGD